jgi:hypothetical protein
MVHSAQTMHLFWVKISNVSKWTKMSFHLNIITSEYHWVHPKRLLSLWYVWHKLCTYLAQTLTPSPNWPKWDLTWPTSPRVSIGCVQNDFRAYGTFNANRAPNLRQKSHYLQTDQNVLSHEPHQHGVPSGASEMISDPMVCLTQTVHLSCSDTNTVIEWTEMSFHLSHIT